MDTETLTDVASTAAQQMSMWDLVWASDMVTKVVMIGLIAKILVRRAVGPLV